MGTIVVGVDGSEGARRALEWALRQARKDGSTVEIVHGYSPPGALYPYPVQPEGFEHAWERAGDQADQLMAQVLDELGDEVDGVRIERVTVRDRHPADSLVDRSRHADLLVVGSRGLGGFAGMLLGSVSQQCVHHAACPVVVVKAPDQG